MDILIRNKDNTMDKLVAQALIGFDSGAYHNDRLVSVNLDQDNEIGFVKTLLMHMIQNGATREELSNIVRYSMVVIDAIKKKLDWKKAAEDFRVSEMKYKYMVFSN